MQQGYEIIYPEARWVSEAQIKRWYLDAVANGEAEHKYLTDIDDMAEELSYIGHIVLRRCRT
jgi:hypothetical protein